MWLTGWRDDLFHAWRRLRQRPSLTVVSTLTLALGLGANIAIFTLVHAVAIQPLPVRAPQELYRLGDNDNCCVNSGLQDAYSLFSYPLYTHLRDQLQEFDSLTAFQANPAVLTLRPSGSDVAESARVEFVSENYFTTLGVQPASGRLLGAGDDDPAADPVFVMSYRLWADRFDADPALIGSPFAIGNRIVTLVGVTEPSFFGETRGPNPPGAFIALGAEPALGGTSSLLADPSRDWLRIIGRMSSGDASDVQAHANATLRQWLSAQTGLDEGDREAIPRVTTPIVSASAGVETLRMAFQAPLTMLFVMSGLVLVIASANLANLLIAHSDRGQAAMRVALGASPRRLVRQSMAEGLVLSALGAVAGVGVAGLATRTIVALVFPTAVSSPVDVSLSPLVLAFTVVLALVTGALFSAAPAWVMSRTNPLEALRGIGRGGEAKSFLPRRSLVVVQVALSLVLLTGAGLLVASLEQLQSQPLGFDPVNRFAVRLDVPATYAGDVPRLTSSFTALRDEISRVPGVRNVTYSLYSPMEGNNWSSGISIDGRTADPESPDFSSWNRVGPDYFETLGTRIVRGRGLTEQDTPTAPLVVVVNEAFVSRYFEADDPLGHRLGIGGPESARDYEIVGVSEDVKYSNADRPARPMIFISGFQVPAPSAGSDNTMARSMLLRAVSLEVAPGTGALEPLLRAAVARADPQMSVVHVRPMTEQVAGNFRTNRLLAGLTSAYGILALALAFLGLYAVTSNTVARQTREIGVRMALGADARRVIGGVVRGAVGHTLIGVIVGVPAALLATRTIASLLYQVEPRDPLVLAGAAVVLLAGAAIAALVPARRAASVDPTRALRG